MRHAVYNIRPIFNGILPYGRHRVALDAAMHQKSAAFAQRCNINMPPACRSRHLRSNRRDVIGQLAGQQATDHNEKH